MSATAVSSRQYPGQEIQLGATEQGKVLKAPLRLFAAVVPLSSSVCRVGQARAGDTGLRGGGFGAGTP